MRRGRVLGGAAAAILVACGIALATGLFPQEPLRAALERALRTALGGEVRIGGLHVVPALLHARATDVSLGGPGYAFAADEVEVELGPAAVAGHYEVARLVVRRPRLRLEAEPGRDDDESTPPGPLPRVLVADLRLEDGSVEYVDEAVGVVAVAGLSAEGGIGAGRLEVRAGSGSWTRGETRRALRSLEAGIDASGFPGLRLERLAVVLGSSRLSAHGPLGTLPRLAPALDWQAQIDVSDLAAFAPPDTPLEGTASLSGRLEATGEAVALRAHLTAPRLRWGQWAPTEVEARAELREGRATLSAGVGLAGGSLRLAATLEGERAHAELTGERLAIGELAGAFGTQPPMSGSTGLRLVAEGPWQQRLDWTLEADADTRFGERRIEAQGRAEGTWTAGDGRVVADWNARAESPEGSLQLDGRFEGPEPLSVRADIEGALTDLLGERFPVSGHATHDASGSTLQLTGRPWGGTLRAEARLAGDGLERLVLEASGIDLSRVVAEAAGRLDVQARLAGPFEALEGEGTASVDALGWQARELGALSAELRARRGVYEVSAELPAPGVSGTFRIVPGEDALAAAIALASTPLALLGALEGIEGEVSGEVEVRTSLSDPIDAVVQAEIEAAGRAWGLAWETEGPAAFTWGDGMLDSPGARLRVAGGRIAIAGRAGPDAAAPLDLRIVAAGDLSEAPVDGVALAGTLDAELDLKGTTATPRLHGAIDLRDVNADRQGLPSLSAPLVHVGLEGTAARVAIEEAALAGGQLSLEGSIPLAAVWRAARADPEQVTDAESADLRLEWRGLDAAVLAGTALAGRVDGEARVRGGLTGIEEVHVTATLPTTRLEVEGQTLLVSAGGVELEAGRLFVRSLSVETPGGTFRTEGSYDLLSDELDVRSAGGLDLAALTPWLEDTTLRGVADVELDARGTLEAPRLEGRVRLEGASVRVDTIPHPLTDIAGTLRVAGGRVQLEEGRARLGGGDVTFSGGAALQGTTLSDVNVDIVGRDMALRYPEGLRSRMDADLTLTGGGNRFELAGGVRVERGLYDLDVAANAEVVPLEALSEAPSLLEAFGLDVVVWINNPIRVRNDLARLSVTGRLEFRGDMANPTPFGRLDLLPGGELTIQERSFDVESGGLTYRGDWNPAVEARARTVVKGVEPADPAGDQEDYAVSIQASGTLDQPRLSLTSVPALTEREIAVVVATGRLPGNLSGQGGRVAGEQAASLLAGRLSRDVSEELEGLGLDEVSIQPELIARDTGPGARFTFGKRLSRYLRLVYSFSLKNPEDRFIKLEALPGYGVTLLAQREDDGSFTFGAGQRLSLGGPERPEGPGDERIALASVTLLGVPDGLEAQARDALKLHEGRRVSFWDVQDDADRLREALRKHGHLEVEVGASLDEAAATFDVRPGPLFAWRVEGTDAPPGLEQAVGASTFEEEALDRGREAVLRDLRARGHLRARVETRTVVEANTRVLVFEAHPGPLLRVAQLRYPGARLLGPEELTRVAGGVAALLDEADAARAAIRDAYADRHHLAAQVGEVGVREEQGRLWLEVPVEEGPRARIASVSVEGAEEQHAQARDWARLDVGAFYGDAVVRSAADRVREGYYRLGYANARVAPRARVEGSDVAVTLEVSEGPRVTVGSVEVVGVRRTSESLVRSRLGFAPGDALDLGEVVAAERRLQELGTFDRVAISHSGNPATLRVEVEETARLVTGYHLRYNDDIGLSGDLDAELRNLFRRGVALGLRYEHSSEYRETRGSLQFPALIRGSDLTVSAFESREKEPIDDEDPESPEDTTTITGIELQQNLRLPDHWGLLVGYRFQQTRFRSPVILVEREPDYISSINTTILRETRNDPLDARRGRFWSLNVELSPRKLGSDQDYVKTFLQAFFAHELSRRWGWAHGYRLGLSRVFGDAPLSPFERFFAGGAYSVRGFATDSLGPRDFLGDPAGGEALLVFNQELRYRHPSGLGAAAFVDAGNVFEATKDLSLALRVGTGVGLRWESPVGLLRLDVGFPLDRREDEKAYRLHFSLGQAF